VDLPSAASTLTATANTFVATLPGKPMQIATIDPETGEFQTSTPAAGAAAGAGSGEGAGAGGAAPAPTVDIDGLKHVYAFANVGQNRIADGCRGGAIDRQGRGPLVPGEVRT